MFHREPVTFSDRNPATRGRQVCLTLDLSHVACQVTVYSISRDLLRWISPGTRFDPWKPWRVRLRTPYYVLLHPGLLQTSLTARFDSSIRVRALPCFFLPLLLIDDGMNIPCRSLGSSAPNNLPFPLDPRREFGVDRPNKMEMIHSSSA